jgi:putative tryptophan/tyrosine transport system substrate-binding protein
MRRVSVLVIYPESDPVVQPTVAVLGQSLEKLGWTAGRNIQIDYRWGISDIERAGAAGAELLRLTPDAIVTVGTPAVRALQQATRTVPIVFIGVSEPISQGVVRSLANPGGNITGFTNLEASLRGKFLELLKGIAPQVTRVAVMRQELHRRGNFNQAFSSSVSLNS